MISFQFKLPVWSANKLILYANVPQVSFFRFMSNYCKNIETVGIQQKLSFCVKDGFEREMEAIHAQTPIIQRF